jgi:diaminohydroxyphosphoribosylaminopyrimidine deaminase / 5-amino-6-(5-phosphoribosylamino)uracil reductase
MSGQALISHDAAMRLAVEHAELVKGSTYPNPPVGADRLDSAGLVAGDLGTHPAGSAHGVVVELRRAGGLAAGGGAGVRRGGCRQFGGSARGVEALLDAGVA